jgi:hypothetical protein
MTCHEGHISSGYEFEWPHKVDKPEFVTDKLWKAGRAIIKAKKEGWERIECIISQAGKAVFNTIDHDGTKYSRGEDMENRVRAVIAAIGSKVPLAIFDNEFMKIYLHGLDSKHQTPYRRERNRIVEVIMDYVALEFSKIVSERRSVLGGGFISVSTDFWTNPHRKEQFGALVANLIAMSYSVEAWNRQLFMSEDTAKRLGISLVSE